MENQDDFKKKLHSAEFFLDYILWNLTLGWFKMHDVFRYWLPGHFWEGLYVK